MSQEGANLPQEVEGSHDQAIAPHCSIPAGVGSPRATLMMAGSNSSSVNNLASAADNTGSSSECASPAVLSTDEDNNAVSKIASPTVLRAGEENNAAPKIASPVLLLAGEENKVEFKLASPAVLLAGEEKGNDDGPKFASLVMLQDCDNSKAESDAGVDNNAAARSKLASPTVLHAGDGNDSGSKIASSVGPQAIVDNTATRSKLNNALHADEHNNAEFTLPKPTVLSKDMDSNAGRPRFVSPGSVLLRAGEENKARTKLAIQALPHAGVTAGSSRLTRSAAAALHAAKDNASKLTIQVVPDPYAGKDNNTGSSKAATIPRTVDASVSNAKKGKNNVDGEQQLAYEVDVGGCCRKGNTAVAEDVDHNLHIFTERERRKKMKNMFSTLHGLLPQLPDKADKATIVGETIIYIKFLERTLEKLKKLKMERQLAVAAQQQHGQQQQLLAGAASSSRASSSCHPAPALPAPAKLADMVHGLHAQQAAAVAAANNALVTGQAAAAAAAAAGAGGSSSAAGAGVQQPRGTMPFPAPAVGFQTWTGHNVALSVANNEAYINLHCPRELGTLTKALSVLERNHIEVVTTTVSTQDGFRMYGIHARVNPASVSARFPENLCAEDRFKLAVSEMVQMINNA